MNTVDCFKSCQKFHGNTSFKEELRLFTRHSIRDIKRRKCHFCLAFGSIFVAVFVTLVANTLMALGPVFFLYFVEERVGQYDAILVPAPLTALWFAHDDNRGFWDRDESLNYTKIIQEFGDTYNVAPRGLLNMKFVEAPDKSWNSVKGLAIIDTEREN